MGIVAGTETISKKILNKAVKLQVISRCGTGVDNIHKDLFKSKIKIFKTDKEPVAAVSEFVLTQILSILKNSFEHNFYMKKRKLEKKIKGNMLSGKSFWFHRLWKNWKANKIFNKTF